MISKILMQKTKFKQEDYVIDLIKKQLPEGWVYINYCNGEEEQYFKDNPLEEFPNIVNQWNKIPFVGTVGNDTLISEIEGPRITIHLDLPFKYKGVIYQYLTVKHKDIKPYK
jgi:hypothetical protein